MKKVFVFCCLFVSMFFVAGSGFAQKGQHLELKYVLDSINEWLGMIAVEENDDERIMYNNYVISYMDMLLHDEASFEMPFDSVKYLKVLETPGRLLRVYTWNVYFNDGSFKYFGYLQYKHKKQLLTFRLVDYSDDESDIGRSFSSHKEWYGAIYYEVVEKKWNKRDYYLLIGWDGADRLINRKIIETLTFTSRGLPDFGVKSIVVDKEKMSRMIFEYAEMASMILRYNEKQDIVVIDHLAPSNPRFTGHYQYYGPDFSFDALQYNSGKWYFMSDVDPNKAINYERNKNIEKMKKRGFSKQF